jgi:ubiquinone/menaquinone biosynthesis C-methylase UbiE
MYEKTADSYSEMMDQEMQLPIYSDMLGRLNDRIAQISGALLDTACGSGHMLSMYRECFDANRPLAGVDLSPRMVAIARNRLGPDAKIVVGDMRDLSMVKTESTAAVLNFFAVHHLDQQGVLLAATEWRRVLCAGGQLVVAAWEGTGPIDYGEEFEIVALRYTSTELASWFEEAGLVMQRCVVEPVEDFPMDAVYLECCKD